MDTRILSLLTAVSLFLMPMAYTFGADSGGAGGAGGGVGSSGSSMQSGSFSQSTNNLDPGLNNGVTPNYNTNVDPLENSNPNSLLNNDLNSFENNPAPNFNRNRNPEDKNLNASFEKYNIDPSINKNNP